MFQSENVLSLAVIDNKVIIMCEQEIVSFSKNMNVTLEEVREKLFELENWKSAVHI